MSMNLFHVSSQSKINPSRYACYGFLSELWNQYSNDNIMKFLTFQKLN